MSRTSKYYDPNDPYRLAIAITATERRLKDLRIREEIAAIDYKLKLLKKVTAIYPAQKADTEQPSALHTRSNSLARSEL